LGVVTHFLSLPAVLLSKVPGMGPLVKAASTSVGQKILMAITGLLLCGFLVTHLAGNLLLIAGEEQFNHYAETLHSYGPLLNVAEIGLAGLFLAHIGLALSTNAMNRTARERQYAEKDSKQTPTAIPGGAYSWMFATGVIIAFFLVVHITDMRLKQNPFITYEAKTNEFLSVRQVLTNYSTSWLYVVGLVALGIHLTHGFRSALQTLGANHPRWNRVLEALSLLFAFAVAGGFLFLYGWASITSL